ncbi:pyridoxamine 5'-phosphate oxidase family protein [Streptomyces sp. NPDC051940]|uniref:pyridoxamine 5'-phosphate oxidase family protein n=1 Tax=Streptomyces sp. NPDC051940 TaxID=3155675 RepID=UPI003436F7E6
MATYTKGELAVQRRAGVSGPAGNALRGIRSEVPEVAAVFLAGQPMIVAGAADPEGRIWATVLTGRPGFLSVPEPGVLAVGARPLPGDPLADILAGEAKLGTIAIEPATRRRMRLNGTSSPYGEGLRVRLDQVISNCPKYLQKREYGEAGPDAEAVAVRRGAELTVAQQLAVSTADTFFVATASPEGDADASHRGGNPGFVEVLSPTRLRWPDYLGNGMFLTLGNLADNPAAGLVFPDWDTGALLQVTGDARVVWEGAEVGRVPGAERLVEFEVTGVNEIAGAVPLRWSEPEFSRFNPPVAPAA